jgi:hypothetical protein
MKKQKSNNILSSIHMFNHNIIDHYQVAWKSIKESKKEISIIIHNIIDLNTLLPIDINNTPDSVSLKLISIVKEKIKEEEEEEYEQWEEDIYERYERDYEGL